MVMRFVEMLACCWGIEHFDVYLKGRKFVIYSDHRPFEKLSCMHEKTLNRLTHKMNKCKRGLRMFFRSFETLPFIDNVYGENLRHQKVTIYLVVVVVPLCLVSS